MDWDEELKRQAAISALLAPPEDGQALPLDTQTDEQVTAEPDVLKPDKSDWHKLAAQTFDTTKSSDSVKTDEQITAQPDTTVYPTIAQDQPSGPPKDYPNISSPAPEPADIKTDEDTGTRYVQDPLEGKIPHAELATAADKEAFKPGDVTLPQVTAVGENIAPQVRRGEEWREPWHPSDETPPAKGKPIPGFVTTSQNAIVNPAAGVIPPTPKPAYPAQIVTPEEASGAKSTVNAPLGAVQLPNAPITGGDQTKLPNAPTTPPDQSRLQVAQPVVGGQGFFGGDLTQGPPGTKPDGTEDEPYWPKTDKDVVLLPPGANYIDPKDQSQKVTPGAPAPATATAAPAVAPAAAVPAGQAPVIQPSTDDWNKLADSAFPSTDSKTKPTASSEVTSTVQVDGTPFPERINAVDGSAPKAFIVHHTGGREKDANGVLDELNQRHLGVEFVAERDGRIVQIGGPGSQNIKTGWGKGEGLNNSNVVGIEVIAKDDKDVTPAQIQAVKNFHAAVYGNVPAFGHGEVNPGHKEADEGLTITNAIRAGGDGQTGEPGTTPIETLVKLDQSGLNVTHFGYEKPGEANWDKDSANGNGKYVQDLSPGYDVALNSAGAALVGNPRPGETFHFAGREWRYGDAASEKLKDPRFDIFDPTGNALSGSVQLGRAEATEPKEQSLDDLAKDWIKVSPEDQAAADKQGQDSQMKILTDLQNKAPNLPAFMHALENPIQGISDADRNAKAAEIKKQLTVYAQDYYKEPDPDKAYARVMAASENPVGTAAGELISKLGPNFMHAWLSLKQQTDSPIQTRLIDFINQTHPDASPEARTALISQVMAKTGRDRVDFVNAMYDHAQKENPESVKNINMLALHDSIDVASQPGMEAKMDQYHTWVQGMVTQNLKDLREDPSLEHTALGSIANATPAMIKNIVEVAVPYIGQSAMLSEVYTDTLDGLRREHPELSEDQLKAMAASKSLPQAVLQELVNAGTMGVGGSALSSIKNPIARIITSGLAHGVVGGGAGTAQQALSNVMTGRPAGEGLPEAGTAAFIQSFLGGAWGGRHGEAEAPPPGESEPTRPLAPEPIVPPEPALRPITKGEVLGPDEPSPPVPARPWYMQGAEPGQDPLVIRGAERTTFTPQEMADVAARAPSGSTPEELRNFIEQLQSPTGVHLGDEGNVEVEQTQQTQAQTQPPLTVAEAIQKAKTDAVAASLRGTPAAGRRPETATPPQPMTFEAPPPRPGSADAMTGGAGVEEPWVSNIANKYVKERMAAGELGTVEPGIGHTTEEMLMQGLKMNPDEINQHRSDIMQGKGNQVEQTAAMRAEEARLSHRSHEASLIAEADPNNSAKQIAADNALKDLTDLYNGPMKKLKQNWRNQGVAFQDRIPIDLSTYNGIRAEFIKSTGRTEVPAQAEAGMRKSAAQVRVASDNLKARMQKLGDEAEKNGARRKLPTIDQVAEEVMRAMGHDPCPV